MAFIVLISCNLGINFPYTEIETQKQGAVITKPTQYKHQSSCWAAGSKGLDSRWYRVCDCCFVGGSKFSGSVSMLS